MRNRLEANREKIEHELARSLDRQYFSAAFLAQHQTALPLVRRYVRGRTIDLGCGTMPFASAVAEGATTYHTLDLWPRSEQTTYVGDIQDMHMIEDSTYDTALCFEVLEHVPDPGRAMMEVYRILRPGGYAVISVPHLSRLHNEPHDYYRFTRYGLHHLAQDSGFEIEVLQQKGGLFSFLAHQASSLLLAAVWPIPGLRQVAWFLNRWLITLPSYALDRATGGSGIFALGWLGVARKPLEQAQEATQQDVVQDDLASTFLPAGVDERP